VTWTLAIEVQFYVLAALIIYVTPIRYIGLVCAAIIVFAIEAKQEATTHAVMAMTQTRLDGPFVGVFCSWLWRYAPIAAFSERHQRVLVPAASLLLIGHYCAVNYGLLCYPISGSA
jgi:peptidoglycan/LPS O-acetylase OafA/YrhL